MKTAPNRTGTHTACADPWACPAAAIDHGRRRTVLAGAIACALPMLAAPSTAVPMRVPAADARSAGTERAREAIGFIQRHYDQKLPVVYNPVSLLQRRFRLGYSAALGLAAELERLQFWQIHVPPSGRLALLNPGYLDA